MGPGVRRDDVELAALIAHTARYPPSAITIEPVT
jgi:hypothetical protein